MNVAASKLKAKGSAPGQYRGFALQELRLFYHLLTCSDEADVGLEYIDDVSVHVGGHVVCAEQCKSALSGNPISNWAVDFWKTLANWVYNVEQGLIDPSATQFSLYVVPVKNAGFAADLHALSMETEIDKFLHSIRKRHEKLTKVPECEAYYDQVFSVEAEVLHKLIKNFQLANDDIDPFKPINHHLAGTIRPDLRDSATNYGIGEAKRRIEEAIRNGEPPLINAKSFRKKFYAFISAHDNERFLHSLSDEPSDEILADTISSAPCFIRQLDLVEAAVEEKTRAASEYLRSSVDRTRWADEGEIFEGSLRDYDSSLLRRHQNLKTEIGIAHGTLSKAKQGHLLYARCCSSTPLPLEGRVVPEYFLSGTLNRLSDKREIGWHPDFDTLLDSP